MNEKEREIGQWAFRRGFGRRKPIGRGVRLGLPVALCGEMILKTLSMLLGADFAKRAAFDGQTVEFFLCGLYRRERRERREEREEGRREVGEEREARRTHARTHSRSRVHMPGVCVSFCACITHTVCCPFRH